MDYSNKPTLKFSKIIILSVFFAFYLVLLWFSFSSKGIFVDGHFYRKSANMTTVTYTCRNPFADHKKIVLQKQVDSAVITVDSRYTISVYSDGSWQQTDNSSLIILDGTDWASIADQSAESSRIAATHQPYFLTFIVYGLFALSKIYSTKIYEFFFKNRAAGENYYKFFDTVFTIITIGVMLYFILPV